MELLIQYALQFIGRPYRWGGDDPMAGFDCSGFVQELLASVGEDPPGDQTAQSLYDHFRVEQRGQGGRLDTGTLLFFGKSVTEISHVAMSIDNGVRMIEAGGGGSKTVNEAEAIKANAYIRVRAIKNRKDLVAAIRPYYTIEKESQA